MTDTPANAPTLLLQLEDQVAAALDLPDKARALAFQKLREAYPEHDALLERCERAAASLEPELRSVDELSHAVRRAALAEAPEQIGSYKILDVLGEGGMGIVYLADQQEPVRRRVALKVIKTGAVDRDVLARFEVERQSLAMMNHPNIAKVLDAGETDDGRPFFAMEHVPGIPITEFCDRQRLPLAARIELFQKVCHGVQHAHQKGVIHRDLKPSNVLVMSRDGLTEPKIIDFGVAKALQQRLTERTLYTEQGRILGTPEYMSPEQAEMSVLDVDTRSDIYSLGVLLYNLLAGVLPIDGRELRQAGYFEMQRRIREDEPQRPSTRVSTIDADSGDALAERRRIDPRRLTELLRGDLDWIAMRCLEKDPGRRYQSASELAADLQRHLDDEPVLAGPPSALYRLRKLVRRHRAPFLAGATALLALLVGLSIAVWQYRVASASAEDARLARQTAEDNLETARRNEDRAVAAEQRAAQELEKRRALNLADASMRALEQDPIDGLLLALAAVDVDETPVTLGRVQTALAENFLERSLPAAPAPISGIDVATRTRTILQACSDGSLQLYSEDGNEILTVQVGSRIVSARFSTDEQKLLVVTTPEPVRMVARSYDRLGRPVAAIGDTEHLTDAAWAPDGSRVVVRRAEDGRVELRDPTGNVAAVLLPGSPVQPKVPTPAAVCFSPQGAAVLVQLRRIRIWPDPGEPPVVLQLDRSHFPFRFIPFPGRPGPAVTTALRERDLQFDPRGELVLTQVNREDPQLWSMAGEPIAQLRGHSYTVRSMTFSPNGDAILTAGGDGSARVWSRDGQQTNLLRHGAEVGHASFLAGTRRIVTSNLFSTVLWSWEGRRLAEIRGSGKGTFCRQLTPGRWLLRTGRHCSILDLAGSVRQRLRGEYDRPYQIALHPDGSTLATSETGHVMAWSADGAKTRVFDPGSGQPTYGVAASLDGTRIAAGGRDGTLYLWDWQTGEPLPPIEAPNRGVSALTHVYWLEGDTRLLVAASPTRTAWLVDLETRKHRVLMDRGTGPCVWAFASPDGRLIALQSLDHGRIRFCDSEGQTITDFRTDGDEGSVAWRIAFDRGGRWLGLAGGGDVSIWDLQAVLRGDPDLEPIHRTRPSGTAYGIDFSPDGNRFVVALDGSAYVADLDGTERFRVWPRESQFSGYLPPVAMFSADGKWLLGAAPDGVRRWPADKAQLLHLARGLADRHGQDHDLSQYRELLEPVQPR